MKKIALITLLVTGISQGSAFAGAATENGVRAIKDFTFVNPCERGPRPKLNIINEPNTKFVRELLDVYPALELGTAEYIAFELCSDLSLVGDNQGLTRRLEFLVKNFGN